MDFFFALGEPRRRRIVELIASRGEMPAGEICRSFDITPQAVSQHLAVLRESGLLRMRKMGQKRIYSINTEPILELDKWARDTTALWNGRFDALDRVLDLEKKKNAKMVIVRQRQTNRRGN
jgi:DNA-binding transcriptional ArsR family regulator